MKKPILTDIESRVLHTLWMSQLPSRVLCKKRLEDYEVHDHECVYNYCELKTGIERAKGH